MQARESADAARSRVASARADLEAQPVRTETSIEEARAALVRARATYDTTLRGARDEEVERSELAVVQAENDLTDAEATIATLERGARPEEIAAAEAGLRQSEASVESAQASLDLILAGARAEDVALAESTLSDAEGQVALRLAELNSQKELAEGGYVSPNALKASETAYESAVASRDSAKERLALVNNPYRPEEIDQSRASLASAKAALERATHDIALLKTRTTPEDLTSARARRDSAKARIAAAKADLRLTRTRSTKEDIDTAEAGVRQAEAGLARAEAERVAIRKQRLTIDQLESDYRRSLAALEQAADTAGYSIIHAPINGMVTRATVEEGEYVQGGAIALPSAEIAMVVITGDTFWIDCNIDEADIDQVELKQEVEIFLTDTDILKGHVHHISPSVRLVQGDVRTFTVEVALDEPTTKLRSGMSVDADIIVKSEKDVVTVPAFAVFDDGKGDEYVYQYVDGKAEKKKITKGAQGIERTEILDGVGEGDDIITSLEAKGLADGKKVKIRETEDDGDDADKDDEPDDEDDDADDESPEEEAIVEESDEPVETPEEDDE